MAKPSAEQIGVGEVQTLGFTNHNGGLHGYLFNVSLTDEDIRGDVMHLIDQKISTLRDHMVRFAKARQCESSS